jgi:hypothetical protein
MTFKFAPQVKAGETNTPNPRVLGNSVAYVSAVRQRADGRSRIMKRPLQAEWGLFTNIASSSK